VVLQGYGAEWYAQTPSPAIAIVHAFTPVNTVEVDCTLNSDGFTASYYWGDNGQNYGTQAINYINGCSGGLGYADGINTAITPSRYFGWQVACSLKSSCQASDGNAILGVNGIQLTALENTGPLLDAVPSNNLWYASGWVRGTWSVTLDASDPSGVCGMATVIDSTAVASWGDSHRDVSSFTQCHGFQLAGQLDTTKYSDGHHTLTYGASNAAGVLSAPSKAISIDNAPVTLSLSGPTDAPSTAGTQYVSAVASAGPSGVSAIYCSVDGSSYSQYAGASAQIPVSGVGPHHVACYAQNNSRDPSGALASSPTETWDLSIREPTVSGIAFSAMVDALRCHRVRSPRRHRHQIGRRRVRCHPAELTRRLVVWKTARRHGKLVRIRQTELVRTVVPPHVVNSAVRRVRFGHATAVSGWLGLSNGTPLSDAPVRILASPDDGAPTFTQVATATTGPDGTWSARLPPGPSRLVMAVYDGSATTEPASSQPIRLIVPARVLLRIHPTRTHWRGRITISGRVLGGYIPVGKFLRLRIGVAGVRETVGIPDVSSSGRFRTTWTFSPGNGVVRYWFSVSTLREADYPYAPASSRRVTVTVGPG